MFKNYFKSAWRSLLKNKTSSIINISGLAVGIAIAILIGLWIWDEISFNDYHKNHNSLVQVIDIQTFNNETNTSELASIPMAEALRNNYASDFKHVALVWQNFIHILSDGDKKLSASGVWAQPEFPEMLTLTMLKGSRDALKNPSSVLIAQSVAKAMFGNADPMNKMIKMDNMMELKVAGVFEDLPKNSSFYETKIFLSWDKAVGTFASWAKDVQTDWGTRYWRLYAQMNDNIDITKVSDKIKDIPTSHIKDGNEKMLLYPMNKWRLYNEFENGKIADGRIRFVWMFGVIGLFVLLLACINFMNLSTARSEKRAKEVGVRKTLGSLRIQLIKQFLTEALLNALMALVITIILVQLSLPFFNNLTDKAINVPYSNAIFWLLILSFTIFTGFIAGSYPAFYLSGFNPLKVLKGNFKTGRYASLPRKILLVVQFSVSITLIISTIVVYTQIQFAKNRPIGYSTNGLITVGMNTPDLYQASYNDMRNDLIATGAALNMTKASISSTEVPEDEKDLSWEGKARGTTPLFKIIRTTHDYGNTLGWQLSAGRDFSRSFATDSSGMIINEAALKLIGFKQPVDKTIRWWGKDFTIIGVVKNLVMGSPYKPADPTIFVLNYDFANFITVRINPAMPVHTALSKIETVFKKYNPSSPFEYKFTDEEYARKFADEEQTGSLATIFSVLAVFISCLGLFGLASFVAEQRTKEIGIRKVLGASVFNLWNLLSKEFVLLVIISFIISVPLSYYFMYNWLQNYEYRIAISFWVFIITGLSALCITLITVSFQAIKAAIANPVESLRTE
jgi:putative ABC transport system permease protein